MSVPSADVLRWGHERAKTGSWRGETAVAFLNPLPDAPAPSAEFLLRCLATLAERGFTRVVTGALSPLEQVGFLAAGFDVAERLHLLGLDLTAGLPPLPDGPAPVRVRRKRRGEVLRVDAAAFSTFWGFDERGLSDALTATPRTRFRMVGGHGGGPVAGYAICGRAGHRGFVQRLAVHPCRQRQGHGRMLLLDGLHWMRRHGSRTAVVNTQLDNAVALGLYTGIGFREQPTGLSVLSAGL
ncbi:MAG: GNAT family N-acetyltransferase [Actinomycetota bacterium]|nr:GNAT family N-acetyltransferase [Actinomycetota bacterium]